jgi:hypothetical protein
MGVFLILGLKARLKVPAEFVKIGMKVLLCFGENAGLRPSHLLHAKLEELVFLATQRECAETTWQGSQV